MPLALPPTAPTFPLGNYRTAPWAGVLSLKGSCEYKLFVSFREEADEYVDIGALNGIFVLGRSMGFIGKSAAGVRVLCRLHYFPCANVYTDVTSSPSTLFGFFFFAVVVLF